MQKVFPELVSEDNNGMLAVNYQALVPVLINALKELESETSSLESQMSEFEKLSPALIERPIKIKSNAKSNSSSFSFLL